MLKEKLSKAINRWQEENIKLSPPETEQEIIDCFLAIESLISKDILEFYSAFGGMVDDVMDNSLLSIWTLEKIKQENSTVSELTYFADFLIETYRYAFKYENENTSSIYCDCETSEFLKIADSVEQFFDLYLTNPNEIGLFRE
ncbi:MAG TPA: hypothetical protein VNI84_03875 [Pyrinomonadaceae bacterium]|nr:hypothetical protein [Pyrinomonadaceae bacterium]